MVYKIVDKAAEKALILGNPDSDTAIITLWTMKDAVAKKIDKKEYAVIGQLYNAERGIDVLVRSLMSALGQKQTLMARTDYVRF